MVEYADEMRAESARANGIYGELVKRHCGNPVEQLTAQLAIERIENKKLREALAEKEKHIDELQIDILTMTAPKAPFYGHKIALEVAKKYRIRLRDLISNRRDRYLVHARQEAMWMMRHLTELSLPRIGKILGGRDHTTVLHGIRQHEKRLEARNGV